VITEGCLTCTSFKAASRLPQIITVLPSRINLSVNPSPMTLAAPVINILLFDNFISFQFFCKAVGRKRAQCMRIALVYPDFIRKKVLL
jgi:hypothetical protein